MAAAAREPREHPEDEAFGGRCDGACGIRKVMPSTTKQPDGLAPDAADADEMDEQAPEKIARSLPATGTGPEPGATSEDGEEGPGNRGEAPEAAARAEEEGNAAL